MFGRKKESDVVRDLSVKAKTLKEAEDIIRDLGIVDEKKIKELLEGVSDLSSSLGTLPDDFDKLMEVHSEKVISDVASMVDDMKREFEVTFTQELLEVLTDTRKIILTLSEKYEILKAEMSELHRTLDIIHKDHSSFSIEIATVKREMEFIVTKLERIESSIRSLEKESESDGRRSRSRIDSAVEAFPIYPVE